MPFTHITRAAVIAAVAVVIAAPAAAQSGIDHSIANADEFETWPFAAMGDLNRDLVVDVSDLLGAWGPVPRGSSAPADFNNDGSVGVRRLVDSVSQLELGRKQ